MPVNKPQHLEQGAVVETLSRRRNRVKATVRRDIATGPPAHQPESGSPVGENVWLDAFEVILRFRPWIQLQNGASLRRLAIRAVH